MNAKGNIKLVFSFLLALLIQVFLLRDMGIGGMAFLFIYTYVVIKAPLDINKSLLVILAFFAGWLVDWFYDTHGLHAFALVLIAFFRSFILNVLTPANGYDDRSKINLKEMTWLWYLPYVGSMLLIHHSVLFFLEASDWSLFGLSLLKIFFSTLLGLVVFVLLELFAKD
ncbi:MAG: hypothetical protein RJA76_991 [Bacteroidota bacterium]|jgi:hypothetical protein